MNHKRKHFVVKCILYNARIIQIHYSFRIRAQRGAFYYFIVNTRPYTSRCRFGTIVSEKYTGISVYINNFYKNDQNRRNVNFLSTVRYCGTFHFHKSHRAFTRLCRKNRTCAYQAERYNFRKAVNVNILIVKLYVDKICHKIK